MTAKFHRIAFATTLLLAAAALALSTYQSMVLASDIDAARKAIMFKTSPTLSQVELEQQLLANPLQPDLLHGLIATRVLQRNAKTLSAAERSAMVSLGWQSTVIQVDLFSDGLSRGDEKAVLTRIDGLLRRGKMTDQFVSVLVQIEQNSAQARGILVDMLTDRPSWRRAFLIAPVGFAGRPAILARAATLDNMFKRRLAPRREELAPVVNGLAAMSESELAEGLWRKFHRIGPAAPRPFDPNFTGLASNPLDGQYQTMAYEWQAGSGPGYSAQATKTGPNDAILNIRWDGRAAPVFIRQRLISPPGNLAVVVKGSLLDRNSMRRIAFVFYCGSQPIFHDVLSQQQDGSFIFSANERVPCANPELRLVGISEESLSPFELELTSVQIRQNDSAPAEGRQAESVDRLQPDKADPAAFQFGSANGPNE